MKIPKKLQLLLKYLFLKKEDAANPQWGLRHPLLILRVFSPLRLICMVISIPKVSNLRWGKQSSGTLCSIGHIDDLWNQHWSGNFYWLAAEADQGCEQNKAGYKKYTHLYKNQTENKCGHCACSLCFSGSFRLILHF